MKNLNIKLGFVSIHASTDGVQTWEASATLEDGGPEVTLTGTIERADNDAPFWIAESHDGCYFGGIEANQRDAIGAVMEQRLLH